MATVRGIETPQGPGRLHVHAARRPLATLLLSHGAGGGVDARDLAALATALPGEGFTVALFEQPWRVAGRKIATPPPTLDVALTAARATLRTRQPLVVGGRSAGARSAARSAGLLGASGCLALSFPLHAPGRTEATRLPELQGAGLPTLVVQGERDTMGRPEEFPAIEGVELVVVPGGDHGFKVPVRGPVTQQEAMDLVVEATLAWLVGTVIGNPRAH